MTQEEQTENNGNRRHVLIYLDRPYKIVKYPLAYQLKSSSNPEDIGVIHRGNLTKVVLDWLELNQISVTKYTDPKELDPKRITIGDVRCTLEHPTVIDFIAETPKEATEYYKAIQVELEQQGYSIIDYDCKNIPEEQFIKCPSDIKKTRQLSYSP